MKIAQVAPLYESVPPHGYGGTERVVSYLTEELVREGHDVTLFASGDSKTAARLVPCAPRSLRLGKAVDTLAHHILMLEHVFQHADKFDIIHFHIDYLHFPLSRRGSFNQLTTLHGRLDLPDLPLLYDEFSEMPLVSISNSQRKPLPQANWIGTVYHGLPPGSFTFREKAEKYLLFLGRISPEKRVDRAIEIAQRTHCKLKIGAKIDRVDRYYFNKHIKHLLEHPTIEFVGEVGHEKKNELLGGASALLFPIDWPEPFGLVMIEALACGTPVIAFTGGSVPEIIIQGKTGFIVDEIEEAVDAVHRISSIDRRECRQEFEDRFTDRHMARGYVRIYEQRVARAGAMVAA
jgi:glycosyltransferase involved in cell wall biosynthesis